MRGRGLKPIYGIIIRPRRRSPPVRGRGLKQGKPIIKSQINQSPPVRGRGLKPILPLSILPSSRVAPRAGAWIETYTVLIKK